MSNAPHATATLVCLHGWGGSAASFDPLKKELEGTTITVLTPDLPGFGNEPEPHADWTVADYADWVETWIHSQPATHNSKLLLLGHSFGGQIACMLASRNNVHIDHLFFCAPAIIRRAPSRTQKLINAITGFGKALFAIPPLSFLFHGTKRLYYRLLGVHDYEQASPRMRRIMQTIIRENLLSLTQNVDTPTDLFWGEQDTYTPIADGKTIAKAMTHATLHTFPNVRHAVHKDQATFIANTIKKRLK